MPHLTSGANVARPSARAAQAAACNESDSAAAYRELLHGASSALCVRVLVLALLVAMFF